MPVCSINQVYDHDDCLIMSHLLEVVIAPPSLYLLSLAGSVKNGVQVSAQNAYFKESGAFTGEIR